MIQIIKTLASIIGLTTIFLPVLNVIRLATRPKGRSSVHGRRLRTWGSVVMMTGGFIGLGAILWKPLPLYMSGRLYTMIVVAGVVIYFSGVGIYLWGFFTIRSFFCVSNIAGAELYANHQLITHGPYACVRHPMYLGVFLAAIGGLLIFQTWAMMIFTPMSFVVIKRAEHEEKLLESEFGEKWRQYSLKTPMWLPRIW